MLTHCGSFLQYPQTLLSVSDQEWGYSQGKWVYGGLGTCMWLLEGIPTTRLELRVLSKMDTFGGKHHHDLCSHIISTPHAKGYSKFKAERDSWNIHGAGEGQELSPVRDHYLYAQLPSTGHCQGTKTL